MLARAHIAWSALPAMKSHDCTSGTMTRWAVRRATPQVFSEAGHTCSQN
jgi:hypothetical protein